MRKTVLINGLLLASKLRGMGVYLKNILENAKHETVTVLVQKKELESTPKQKIKQSLFQMNAQIFEQFYFPCMTFLIRPNYTVHSGNSCSLIPCAGKEILLIHDVSYLKDVSKVPESNSLKRKLGKVYRSWTIKAGVNRAHKIVTVSEFAKHDIVTELGVDEDKIFVVPNAINPIFFSNNDKIDFSSRDYDLIFVTGTDLQKNLVNTLNFISKNSELSQLKIAVVGVARSEILIDFPNVSFLGYLENEALKEIYSSAKIFCMPSFYESFAIPALEGYACGCNLVLSQQGAPKSIFGDRAEYFDPNNFVGLERAIQNMLSSQHTTDSELLEKFTWANSAKKFDELFD